MSELKPCPFCGSNDCTIGRGDFDSGVIFFECKRCGVYVEPEGCYDDEAKAVELWNTRAERTCTFKPFKNQTSEDVFEGVCSVCSAYMHDQMIYCPNCGCKVVDK